MSEYDGQTYRPKYHEDLVHSEITLPPNAPKEYADRATLWNAVELSEKGQKSQLARMLKASLPNDWSYELAEEVVRDYVQRNFVDKCMCADWAIQDSAISISMFYLPCALSRKMGSGEQSQKRFLTLMKTEKEYPLSTKRQDSRK